MTNSVNVLFVCILAVMLLLILKQLKSPLALPASIVFSVIVASFAFSRFSDEFLNINSILKNSYVSEYSKTLLKVFGVSFIAEVTSDICKDAGENSIASKVDFLGKVELIIISIPLIEEILKITEEFIL